MANRARQSFVAEFWNESAGCLYDVLNADARDGAIRPSQIFAVSLFHSMLAEAMAHWVVEAVERDLLTHTVCAASPHRTRHIAGVMKGTAGRSRNSAYHQGTVWPRLMGPFVTAYRKVHGHEPQWREAFLRYVEEDRMGQIPEVF